MSDSVRPHRWKPTRLPRPWDPPGKNTGVDCHFRLQCMKVESESEVAQSCPTPSDLMDCSLLGSFVHGVFQARIPEWGAIAFSLIYTAAKLLSHFVVSNSVRPHRQQPTRLPSPWDSPGKNTGVGCHFLLQCMKVKSESEVTQLCPILATSWTAVHQAPPSMGLSRQEYWSGVPLSSPLIYTTIFKIGANEKLLYSTGNSTQYSVMSYMRKEYKKEETYVHV